MNTSEEEERRTGETNVRQHPLNSGEPLSQGPPSQGPPSSVSQILQLMQQQLAQQQTILAELMKQQGTGQNTEAPEKILDSAMIERESTEQVYTLQQKNQNYHRHHQGSSKGFT